MQGPGAYPGLLETLSLTIFAKSSIFDVRGYSWYVPKKINFAISLSCVEYLPLRKDFLPYSWHLHFQSQQSKHQDSL